MITLLMFDAMATDGKDSDEEAQFSTSPQLIRHVVNLEEFLQAEIDAFLDGDEVAGLDRMPDDYSLKFDTMGNLSNSVNVGHVYDVCCLNAVLRRFVVVGTDESFEIVE